MNRFACFLTLVGAVCLCPVVEVSAQEPFALDEWNGVFFRPAPGIDNYFQIDGAELRETSIPVFMLVFDHAIGPVVVDTDCGPARPQLACDVVGEEVSLADRISTLHLTFATHLRPDLQLGVVLPIAYAEGEGMPFTTSSGPNNEVRGGTALGISDPTIRAKYRLLDGRTDSVGLAVVAHVTAPLGQLTADGRYLGDDLPNAGATLAAEFQSPSSPLRGALNLGGVFRNDATFLDTEVGTALTYGGAFEWRIAKPIGFLMEGVGFSSFGANDDQLEGRMGVRLYPGGFTILAGLGAGIVRGAGVPLVRLFAGASYVPVEAPPESDRDRDGTIDRNDRCPDVVEDEDGHLDSDGCPDEDNDRDGFTDLEDKCPDEGEDKDDYEDEDGCPDEDNDLDGVKDGYDSCAMSPEDLDGDRDDDGCPEHDRDRDGVADEVDKCVDVREDTDGFKDDDGCPETDADEDGIADEDDLCPSRPERRSRGGERDGCPDGARAPRPSPDAGSNAPEAGPLP